MVNWEDHPYWEGYLSLCPHVPPSLSFCSVAQWANTGRLDFPECPAHGIPACFSQWKPWQDIRRLEVCVNGEEGWAGWGEEAIVIFPAHVCFQSLLQQWLSLSWKSVHKADSSSKAANPLPLTSPFLGVAATSYSCWLLDCFASPIFISSNTSVICFCVRLP